MRTRKVFRIYATLSAAERSMFGEYLASPYCNKSRRLVDFRTVLEDALVQQPTCNWSPEETWAALPGVATPFRANGFDKLCAELLAALNDFLALQQFRAQPAAVGAQLLEAYEARHLDEWVVGLADGLLERHTADLQRDAEGLYAHLIMQRAVTRASFRKDRMPDPQQFSQVDSTLNQLYFALKLELAAAADAFDKGYQPSAGISYMDWVGQMVIAHFDTLPAVVQAQALGWLMSHRQEEAIYLQLRSFLHTRAAHLAPADVVALYQHALNFCIRQLNAENEAYELELDKLYVELLDQGVLLVDGKLPAGHFKNIIQVRLRQGATDWVAAFIEDWGSRLAISHPAEALAYNRAVLAFHQGQFVACLRGMETVMRDFKDDIHYGADARVYSIMSIYELNKTADWAKEFDTRLEAFRLYLLRDKKMGAQKKERQLNLVKQFRRLMVLYQAPRPLPRAQVQKALEKLKDLRPAANRKWFEQQVRGLGDKQA